MVAGAPSPVLTLAPASGAARLVVIVLRGAMDGLSVIAPYGDPDFAALGRAGHPDGREDSLGSGRGRYADLDGFYALHPALAPLLPLWQAGSLAAVHAVATPYRDHRSHFDGQDMLEFGQSPLASGAVRSGWLTRLLNELPGATEHSACAVGSDLLPILSGPAAVHRWSPEVALEVSARFQNLCLRATAEDPALSAAFRTAFETATDSATPPGTQEARIAHYAATRLNDAARIAAFAIDGWDTHSFQDRNLTRALERLVAAILALKSRLTPRVWDETTILAVTEFGRTVRFNGTGGTDHGTAGAMLLCGGALRGGRIVADWPGLTESALYDRRDLFPTSDLRATIGGILRARFGLTRQAIENRIFPGLELEADPGLI